MGDVYGAYTVLLLAGEVNELEWKEEGGKVE